MAETKVNLRHLLENIRDSYQCPIDEAILTELIANALDSSASRIEITADAESRCLTFVDNGRGMIPREFRSYHDIAASDKVRGHGIGFAGVGAKLSLLICDRIVTETKKGKRHSASEWRLATSVKAPWERMPPLGLVQSEHGTGVRLFVKKEFKTKLMDEKSIREIVQAHFYPLLDDRFLKFLCLFYPKGVTISVNGREVRTPEIITGDAHFFQAKSGRQRKEIAVGFLLKSEGELPDSLRGVAVSTFGKVIKRGWEWLGVSPRNPTHWTGVVEVPQLAACLNLSKSDFRKDESLPQFYKCRRAIAQEVGKLLAKLGEAAQPEQENDRGLSDLQREIERVMGNLLPHFPELDPLFSATANAWPRPEYEITPHGDVNAAVVDTQLTESGGPGTASGETEEPATQKPPTLFTEDRVEPKDESDQTADESSKRVRKRGLRIGFDDKTGGDELAWIRGDSLYINAIHPAYERVKQQDDTGLYITFVVASQLASQIKEGRTSLQFVEQFMTAWGGLK